MTHRKIILLAHHGLGDLLMTVPLIRSLQATLQDDEALEILVKAPHVGRVLDALPPGPRTSVTQLDRTRAGLLQQIARLRASRPRLVLAPHSTTGLGAALVVRGMGAERSYGPAGPYAGLGFTNSVDAMPGAHKVDLYYSYARAAGRAHGSAIDLRLRALPPALGEARAELDGLLDTKLIAIAPGSGIAERHKRWPAEQWKELGSRLLERVDARLLLIGTRDEQALLHSIRPNGADSTRVRTLTHPDPLVAHAALSRACLAIAACSGAAHLAAAAGTPVVGLFGPTNPAFTGATGIPLHVVRTDLDCAPCYRTSLMSGCGNAVCMKSIEVGAVFAAVRACLDGVAPAPVPWCPTTEAVAPTLTPGTDRAVAGGVG